MTGPDYQVSPAALDETAAGIEAVLDGLRALGPVGSAEEGHGVVRLASMPGDVGHAALSTAFVAFCNRWEWGVRDAVRTGRDMADELRAAAASYGHADEAGEDLLARVAYDLLGDPGAAGDTWADVAASGVPDWRMPDWSELAGRWADTGRAAVDNSLPELVERAADGVGPLDRALDDLRPIVQ